MLNIGITSLLLPMTLNVADLTAIETQYYLQHLIAPRPIALASTVDEEGTVNLSPFSFFNLFSINPAIIIFSATRRLRNNTTKHTLDNIRQVPEVAISIVTRDIVHQASLAGCDYPKGTNGFVKAGFTPMPSTMIAPPYVAEARASLECRVNEIKSLGENCGAGQLVIAEVLCIHIDDSCVTTNSKIDQLKIEHVARLGGDWYAYISPANLFSIRKPNAHLGIGFDDLPEPIKNSTVLTGNHLAQLAGVAEMPVMEPTFSDERFEALLQYFKAGNSRQHRIHTYVKELIDEGQVDHAWQVLLHAGNLCV